MTRSTPFLLPRRSEAGITGLETAIILIAFVVVATVFSFTVLTSGLFASQRTSAAANSALTGVQDTLELAGPIVARADYIDTTGDRVGDIQGLVSLSFTVRCVGNGDGIDLQSSYQLQSPRDRLLPRGHNTTVINVVTPEMNMTDAAWTVQFLGKNDGDTLLEPGETARITVWLVDDNYFPSIGSYYALGLGPGDPFPDDVSELSQPGDSLDIEVVSGRIPALSLGLAVPRNLKPVMPLN